MSPVFRSLLLGFFALATSCEAEETGSVGGGGSDFGAASDVPFAPDPMSELGTQTGDDGSAVGGGGVVPAAGGMTAGGSTASGGASHMGGQSNGGAGPAGGAAGEASGDAGPPGGSGGGASGDAGPDAGAPDAGLQ